MRIAEWIHHRFTSQHEDRERSQMEIADVLRSKNVRGKTEARALSEQQSTFGGRRAGMPVQYVLEATSLEKLQEYLPAFMQKVSESPVFQMGRREGAEDGWCLLVLTLAIRN